MRGTGCEKSYEIYPVRPSNENFLAYIIFSLTFQCMVYSGTRPFRLFIIISHCNNNAVLKTFHTTLTILLVSN